MCRIIYGRSHVLKRRQSEGSIARRHQGWLPLFWRARSGVVFFASRRAFCCGMTVPFRRRRRRTGGECVQCFCGILRLGWTRAIWWRRVLWQADMMLFGGVNGGVALMRRRVVGLWKLLFLFLVAFWLVLLLLFRVGIEQRREGRHGWRRCCQRISRGGS